MSGPVQAARAAARGRVRHTGRKRASAPAAALTAFAGEAEETGSLDRAGPHRHG